MSWGGARVTRGAGDDVLAEAKLLPFSLLSFFPAPCPSSVLYYFSYKFAGHSPFPYPYVKGGSIEKRPVEKADILSSECGAMQKAVGAHTVNVAMVVAAVLGGGAAVITDSGLLTFSVMFISNSFSILLRDWGPFSFLYLFARGKTI